MAINQGTSVASARITMILSVVVLILGFLPGVEGRAGLRAVLDSARSPELNRAEREVQAAGYYEGLIGGGEGPEGARGELALRLMGKPNGWVRFNDADVARHMPGDFLQFELSSQVERMLFGQRFVTNSHGMHSAEVTKEKSPGTFRIAVLGASMDMGWGVTYQETYSHQLQEWLNQHARRQGLASDRRFEVLNFAVAAYSPLQRLETLRRKVLAFGPDLVIYSATMLDVRLTEIHLCDVLRNKADLTYGFVAKTLERAGVSPGEREVDGEGRLVFKDQIKAKLNSHYWELYDETLGAIAGECRAAGVPLAIVIVPRVGKADAPPARAEPLARLKAIAGHYALTVHDLTDTFDRYDPARLEIAAWDDHPNGLGHHRLFLALARSLVKDPESYHLLFPASPDPSKRSPTSAPAADSPSPAPTPPESG